VSATVDGITMRYVLGSEPVEREPDPTDWIRHADYLMSRAFLRAIEPGHVVADVGAFKGGYSVLASAAVGPSGEVVAFEPAVANHPAIERNAELNGAAGRRISLCRKAVSDRVGTITFYSAGAASENSFYSDGVGAAHRGDGEVSATTVETIDLDTFFEGRRQPNVVKIDTEGAEFAVLRGADRILATGAAVICEFHPYAWHEAGHSQEDFVGWLAGRGRSIVDLRTMQAPNGAIVHGPYRLDTNAGVR
jgi:FkbM family methyltransferase